MMMDVILPDMPGLDLVWPVVMGRPLAGAARQSWPGLTADAGRGAAAALLCPDPSGQAAVWQLTVSAAEKAHLDHYHNSFDITAIEHDGVWLYAGPTPTRPASLTAQEALAKRLAAEEIMQRFGPGPIPMGPLLNRACAKARAQASALPPPSGLSRADVTELGHDVLHRGFFGYDRLTLQPKRFDGSPASVLTREVFHTIDAALVLPYDPQQDQVLLVEQFRVGPYLRHDPAPYVLEPAAGLVDNGETPAEAALREAREESGLSISQLIPLPSGYASPGGSSEFFHCFIGLADLGNADGRLGGEASEGEDIRSHVMSFDHVMAMLDDGQINIIPLAMMLLGLARMRPTLR